jgi:hypothetical protein
VTDKIACPGGKPSPAGSISASDCAAPTGPTGNGGQYCAPTNRNECTEYADWTGGSNICYIGSAVNPWAAWDGTTSESSPYRAIYNGYGIKASTWACTSGSAPGSDSDDQCRGGSNCWCAYSKSPDTDPSTFTDGHWSSWAYNSDRGSEASCADLCPYLCAVGADSGSVEWIYTPGDVAAQDSNRTNPAENEEYGITESIWACTTAEPTDASASPGANGTGTQIPSLPGFDGGTNCWCGYKNAAGWSSSWAYHGPYVTEAKCNETCSYYCSYEVMLGGYGDAVSW